MLHDPVIGSSSTVPDWELVCPEWVKGSYIKEPFIWKRKRGVSSQESVEVMEAVIRFHIFGSHMTSICQSFAQMYPEIFGCRFIWNIWNNIRSYVDRLMRVRSEGKGDVYWLVTVEAYFPSSGLVMYSIQSRLEVIDGNVSPSERNEEIVFGSPIWISTFKLHWRIP